MFEITYLVHKRRSVNFCLMYFDEGVRVRNTAFMSFMLRNSIRALATALLVLGLIADFQLFHSDFPIGEVIRLIIPQFGWSFSLSLHYIHRQQMSALVQPDGGLYFMKDGWVSWFCINLRFANYSNPPVLFHCRMKVVSIFSLAWSQQQCWLWCRFIYPSCSGGQCYNNFHIQRYINMTVYL